MTQLKLATVCCFMLALLDEVEDKGEEASHIRRRCQSFIDNNPKHLDIIANDAYALACSYTECEPEWNPAVTLVMLWDNFVWELKDKAKLNPKFGEKLMNRQDCSLRAKINSKKIARDCIKAINKTLYDKKDQIC